MFDHPLNNSKSERKNFSSHNLPINRMKNSDQEAISSKTWKGGDFHIIDTLNIVSLEFVDWEIFAVQIKCWRGQILKTEHKMKIFIAESWHCEQFLVDLSEASVSASAFCGPKRRFFERGPSPLRKLWHHADHWQGLDTQHRMMRSNCWIRRLLVLAWLTIWLRIKSILSIAPRPRAPSLEKKRLREQKILSKW